jgi:hypothetical protein
MPGTPLQRQAIVALPATTPGEESRAGLRRLVDRAKRDVGVPFPPGFVRLDPGQQPPSPLALMYRGLRKPDGRGGGRGGEVRLKLYLSLTLLATSAPYDIRKKIPASLWATYLGLKDPSAGGARRVADALSWLEANKFIELERRPGLPAKILMLSPRGDGAPYAARGSRWVRVPVGFWSEEWITTLSGGAVALMLVLMELTGGREKPQPVSADRRKQYNLSPDTWTRATTELVHHRIITARRVPQREDEVDWERLRNVYQFHEERLSESPLAPPAKPSVEDLLAPWATVKGSSKAVPFTPLTVAEGPVGDSLLGLFGGK